MTVLDSTTILYCFSFGNRCQIYEIAYRLQEVILLSKFDDITEVNIIQGDQKEEKRGG